MSETTFPIHTVESAPEGSRETLRGVAEALGTIPNLAAAMSESPTLLKAFFAVREIYASGTLSPVEIQVLSLVYAFENGCAWCMAFHSAASSKEGLSREDLDRLRAGSSPRDARLRALADFGRAMIANRGELSEVDLRKFLDAGFTRGQALEVVLGAGFSVMANFAGHLARAPLGAMFERHAWTRPHRRPVTGASS